MKKPDIMYWIQKTFKLVLVLGLISCTGGNEASQKKSAKTVYPSFKATELAWEANTNYPAVDSTVAVNEAKKSALILLSEQVSKELERLRIKGLSAGNHSLDDIQLHLSLASLSLKENQVSSLDIKTEKKGDRIAGFVTAKLLKTDLLTLLKSDKNLKKLAADAHVAESLLPANLP